MRVPLKVAESRLIADPMRSAPTTSTISARRTGCSMVHITPLTIAPSATCHSASTPANASAARVAAVSVSTSMPPANSRRRSTRSASAPMNAPSSTIGSVRANSMPATSSADPVCSSVYSPTASTSSQRSVPSTAPQAHRRR